MATSAPCTSSAPAPGPVRSMGVVASIRRLYSSSSTKDQVSPCLRTRKIDPPTTAFSCAICSGLFSVSLSESSYSETHLGSRVLVVDPQDAVLAVLATVQGVY